MAEDGQEMTLKEYLSNTLPDFHLANRQFVELRAAAQEHAGLVQAQKFNRVDVGEVSRAYERLPKALSDTV